MLKAIQILKWIVVIVANLWFSHSGFSKLKYIVIEDLFLLSRLKLSGDGYFTRS